MNAPFQIETGIPIPRLRGKRIYPFPEMATGDSFPVPAHLRKSCLTAASRFGREHHMRFTIQKHDGGYRCWRVT